jgi:transcriptional regulator with XRE-family HTH domain
MQAKLSQADLAGCVGVLPEAVSRWENGRATPWRERLAACARTLDVQEHWLRTGEVSAPVVGAGRRYAE